VGDLNVFKMFLSGYKFIYPYLIPNYCSENSICAIPPYALGYKSNEDNIWQN